MFGKKPAVTPKSPQEAIQELREVQDLLNKKEMHLEKKIQEEVYSAKKHGLRNKRAALQALARKKRYEKQLKQIDGTLSTVEYQIEALENASTNTEVLKAMQMAATALKVAHNNMDVDKVQDIMDDIREQQEISQEISDAISQPTGFGHDVNEDELMAELESMQEQDLENKLLDVGGSSVAQIDQLPVAPTGELRQPDRGQKTKQQAEEDQLKELAAWAT